MNFKTNNNDRKSSLLDFNDIVKDIVIELNIENDFLVSLLKNNWEKITGKIMSAHSIPDRIFKNILFISADHSIYANEIMLMKKDIVRKIGDTIGSNIVKAVKVEIKRIKW